MSDLGLSRLADPRAQRGAWLLRSTAVVLSSLLFGVALTAFAVRFEAWAPVVLLGLALAPVVAMAALQDPRIAVSIVFLAIPFGFAAIEVGLLSLQAVDVAVLGGAALIALRRIGNGKWPLSWSAPLGWFVAVIAWAVIASPSAADRALDIKSVGSLVEGLILACMILAASRGTADLVRILGVAVAVGTVVGIQAIGNVGQIRAFYGGTVVSGRAQGLFTEPNELGFFAATMVFAAAGLALAARTPRGRLASSAALGILLVALTLSLSRGAWVGALAGLVAMWLSLREARRKMLALAIPAVLVLGVIATVTPSSPNLQVVQSRVRSLTSSEGLDNPHDFRTAIWEEAVREIRDDPWTGQGPGNYQIGVGGPASPFILTYTSHAHSMFLTIGAEIGLPGLGFFVAFLLALYFAGRFTVRHANPAGGTRALASATGSGLVAFAVAGLFNTALQNAIVGVVFWTMVGALLVCYREAQAPSRLSSAPSRPLSSSGSVVA